MNGSSDSSEKALQDYFDNLLSVDAPAETAYAPVRVAAGGNIATLPAVSKPARPTPVRPYAEPIRTLNLRMPLPPVAVPVVEEARPAVEALVAAELPIVEQRESVQPEAIPAVVEMSLSLADVAATEGDLAQMAVPAAWLANGRPHWAQQPFECLLFKSGGLTLAAPLVELGSIYPLAEGALTTVFGQTSWFMGLLPVKEYNARAIDTARVVMPERYSESMRTAYRYLITLYGSDWGLAVDEVINSVVLDPGNVRWRGQRSKRPWLAGTVVEQMCALLDISQLAWMFHQQDRKRQRPEPA